MKYKKLGNTELEVSLICLGTMTYGEQNNEKEKSQQKLKLNLIKNKLNRLKIYVVFLNLALLQIYFELQ